MSDVLFTAEVEEWRAVVRYEWLYEVSDFGRVRSVTTMVAGVFGRTQIRRGKILAQQMSGAYPAVVLSRNGKIKTHRIHKLVLEAFVGPCPPGMECRHFPDRDTRNNRRDNLSWGTPKENAEDRIVHGTNGVGRKLPAELVERIAARNRGRKATLEQRAAMSARRRNLPPTAIPQIVAEIVAAGRPIRIRGPRGGERGPRLPVTPETRAKMSAAHTGRKHTAETLAKMSESAKRRWAKQ